MDLFIPYILDYILYSPGHPRAPLCRVGGGGTTFTIATFTE